MAHTSDDQIETSKSNRAYWLVAFMNFVAVLLLVVVWLQTGIDIRLLLLVGAACLVLVNGAAWFGITKFSKKPKKTRALFCFVAGGAAVVSGTVELLFHDISNGGNLFFLGVIGIGLGALALRNTAKENM